VKHIADYLAEAITVIDCLNHSAISELVTHLQRVRERCGRLFVLGVGGSAAHATHAASDFRCLCGIEAYAACDNVAELTALTNDEGWAATFMLWLQHSRLTRNDLVYVFSVGGGDEIRNVSPNLVSALNYAKEQGTPIIGVVGRNGGYTAHVADAVVIIPTVNPTRVTFHVEGLQMVLHHLLVSHPGLQVTDTKWEGLAKKGGNDADA